MLKSIVGVAGSLALLSVGLFAWQQAAKLPPPFHTPSANNRPRAVERPEGARLSLPAGFSITEYASGFERPRYMLLGPSKEVLLSDSMNSGSVYALLDTNNDGKVDDKRQLLKGLDRPYGLLLLRDYLYVGETTSIKRYRYNSKALTVGPGEEVLSLKDFGSGHWTRSLTTDRKGAHIYIGIGSRSNVDAGEPEQRAAIVRITPDGKSREIYASGTRNPIGLHFMPGTDQLWAAVQERDGLGDDLVPDYFTSIKPGGFYGWPYAYIGPNEDPRRKGERPDLVAKTITPDVPLGAHVAVLDFLFYTGKQFPGEYQGGAFLAQHGSWNRSKRVGYNVVFIPFTNGKPSGPAKVLLEGWMLDPEKPDVWGRPVGLLQLPDGGILVSDDVGNKIWHISYKG
jgi:glucose/arabinose dehydrogenase